MELFISDQHPADTLSLALELYSNYVRASQRNIVSINSLAPGTLSALQIEQVPLLIKQVSEPQSDNSVVVKEARLTNPFTIMLEIARACYLEDVLFCEKDSVSRNEVGSFVESVGRLAPREMAESVNSHMAQRMFLVGESITAADIVVFSALAPLFSTELQAPEKLALPHAFRWIDHIQHLPGMLDQVYKKSLFTAFPDVEAEGAGLSKSQQKKLAKMQATKAKKAGGDGQAAGGNQQQKKPQQAAANAGGAAVAEESKGPAQQQQPKKQKQKQVQKPKPAAAPVVPDIAQMDIRVGKIIECWVHPESTKLYCEKIDIGNGEIREIASGLQTFVPIETMQGAMCVVLCNLKAKKLGGFPSHGMVLCGETPDKSAVELLTPPAGSEIGDLITFADQGRDPPVQLPPKEEKNPWFRVMPDMKIDANGVAVWKEFAFATEKGNCTSATIKNGVIH